MVVLVVMLVGVVGIMACAFFSESWNDFAIYHCPPPTLAPGKNIEIDNDPVLASAAKCCRLGMTTCQHKFMASFGFSCMDITHVSLDRSPSNYG
jgi:hypothetical protein